MTVRNWNVNQEGHMRHHFTTGDGMQLFVPLSNFAVLNQDRNRLAGSVDPFSESSVQEFPLGTELWYGHRKFRYAKAGATALVAGNLYQSVVPLAGHIDEVVDSAAAAQSVIAFTPNTVTTDDLAADELADGFLHINDDTGEGYMYQIKSHPAITGGTSGNITLFDPVLLTLGANATATVLHHPYRGVIIHPSPPTAKVVGVAVYPVTAAYYGWLQYQGPCAVLTQGTLVIADLCVPSATVNGAVMPSAALETDGPVVGEVMAVNADTEYSPIWLCIP